MTFDTADEAPVPGEGRCERLSPLVRRVIAPNRGPLTYLGTCSYIVGEGDVAIVDPGPAIASHIDALLEAISGEALSAILVTHTHRDHSPAAAILKARTGANVVGCAPYLAAGPAGSGLDASHDRDYTPDKILADGEHVTLSAGRLTAIATPGHTRNHLCFAFEPEGALFTGDHVMAWSTTVVAPPDGSMSDYMASIERLRGREDVIFYPGHGEPARDPQRFLRGVAHHRRQRESAILARLRAGDERIPAIVERLYDGIDRRLHGAAALNVLAHMEDLIARNLVRCDEAPTLAARYFHI